MKIFIYLCWIAHILTVISARLRLTTPMSPALRSNDDAARKTANIAEMIAFVNSAYTDVGRSIARRGRFDPMLRRFETPEVMDINLPEDVIVPNDKDTENPMENLAETVRYQFIDNPEVLEEYRDKQKQQNNEKALKPVVSDSSPEAKSFSTVDKKLRHYHSKSDSTAPNKSTNNITDEFLHTSHPNPLDGVEELTTVEPTYRPSFSDDDDDDDAEEDKSVNDDIEVSVTKQEISTPRADAKNHDDLNINNTVEIEKITLDNKASGNEDQAKIEEEIAQTDDIKDTGKLKHELSLKKDKNNDGEGVTDGVIVNEEKSGSNKEFISSKLDYKSNERPSEGNVHRKDEDYKNDGNKNINVTTDTNSENDNKPKKRAWDSKKVISIPVEKLIGRIVESALGIAQINDNYDYKEQHSIYSHKERNVNSNKQFNNRHEKRDEYDRKKKDEYDDGWSKKEKNWNEIDKKRYNKDNKYDRMEYEWNNRHHQYDKNDNTNENQWIKNNDFNSRDRDSSKKDNDWDKRDNDWKKRDIASHKKDNHWKKRDIASHKRDGDWNKRDNDWKDRQTEWIKQQDYKARKQNEWEHKYSNLMSVENDGGQANERYEIIERTIKDGDYNRHYEI